MWLIKCARLIEKLSNPASRIANIVGATALVMMMLLFAVDVALRYIFILPIKGSSELIELGMVVVVFLAIAYTASQKGHVAIEIVVSRFSQRAQAIIDVITYVLSLLFIILVTWRVLLRADLAVQQKQATVVLTIPLYPFMYLVALGFILLAIVLLADIFNSLAKVTKK